MPRKAKSHYEVLGVDKTASTEEIKQARKRKARKAHPDAGGNAEDMAAINHAFDVLANPERRRLYDATGKDSRRPIEEDAKNVVVEAFTNGLRQDAPDLLRSAKQYVSGKRKEVEQQRNHLIAVEKKLRVRRGKIITEGGENLLHFVIDTELDQISKGTAQLDQGAQVLDVAYKMLQGYKSTEEVVEAVTMVIRAGSGAIFSFGAF
jgi:curved DNA-binding protein CbpA